MNEHEPSPADGFSLAELMELLARYNQEHETDIGKVVDIVERGESDE